MFIWVAKIKASWSRFRSDPDLTVVFAAAGSAKVNLGQDNQDRVVFRGGAHPLHSRCADPSDFPKCG